VSKVAIEDKGRQTGEGGMNILNVKTGFFLRSTNFKLMSQINGFSIICPDILKLIISNSLH